MGYKFKRMCVWLNNKRLPDEYQEVEYIQSSGTQRIDTSYPPTTVTEFEIDYEIVSYIGQYATPFGTRYAHNDRAYYIGYENDNTSYYSFGSNKVDPSTVAFHGVGTRRKITYHNNVLSNGTQSVTVQTNQTPSGTIRVFCEEQNGTTQEYAAMKLYSFKTREGSSLSMDLVPCYRKSDGEIGVYDLVNRRFLSNAGTGTFTKGADVPDMIEKQVWPNTYKPGANTIAYLPLATNSNDLSGNGNNGTDTNITYSNGKAVFNSSGTSRILISGISGTQRTFTLNMIVQITSLSGYQHLYRQGYYNNGHQDNSGGWIYGYDSVRLIASTNRQLTGYVPDGNEHLYTFVVNTGSIKFYVDGTLQYTWTVSIGNVSGAKFCLGGRDYPVDEGLRGTMREVIVENTLRTDTEVLALAKQFGFAS